MININLLPDSMRKAEGLPKKQLLILLCLVAVLGGLVYMVTRYLFVILPELRMEQASLAQEERRLKTVVQELQRINQEIGRMSGYVDAVKGLYRGRTVWAKILADVKNIVNFDPAMSEYNVEQRYLWLTRLTGRGKAITLTGFATAASQVVAMQMPERLLQGFRDYSPVTLPEKDEETRLQEELRVVINEHDAERRERPELPIQGPRELAIRQRLEEIKAVKSGGIALQPFVQFVVPGSLQLRRASWTGAPRPRGSAGAGALFPESAWAFDISMTLK